MHVVKNVAESLTATLFNIKGKTKDTWKSRKDLMDLGLKKSLHLEKCGESFKMPMGCYHFTKNEKQKVLHFLESLKFPDGFSSNISRCVKEGEFQLSRMKSHDFYVFIQRVLPLSIRGCLTKEVRVVLYELSEFIQRLCGRTMYLDVLEKQEEKIVVILCKLERLLPPSFFDIMIHLLIHLPYEAKIAGPPQYRWMFPFERKMRILKGYVKNKARPEGCIAERYIDNECLTFCSMYMNDVETVFNKAERNNEMMESGGKLSVFACKGRPLGGPQKSALSDIELEKIHTYILNNCHEMQDLINEHRSELEESSLNKVNELHGKLFALWLQERADTHLQSYTSEVRILSRGPSKSVNKYTGCMVNGYKFHTQSRDYNRKSQNSGVVVYSDHATNLIDYYGKLQEVLEVEYLGQNKRVLVFKCEWLKVDDQNGIQIDKESGVTSVNVSRKWYKDQPYILASQAKQVFYVPDSKLGGKWNVVEKHVPRSFYDVPVHMEDEVYQEEEPNLNLNVDLNIDHASLTRGNTTLELVDASTFFVGESSRKRQTHHVMDEEFIDDDDDCDVYATNSDDDDVDATNSNSSQEESCHDDDLTHTPTSVSSEKEESFEDDD